MTITTSFGPLQYNGDGSTGSFSVTFPFWDADDLRVIHKDAAGTETVWTRGTQYTVTFTVGSTGTVNVETSPTDYTPASGETLTIKSNVPLSQSDAFPLGGAFPSTTVEQRLDKTVRQIQQQTEELDRSLKLGETTTYSDLSVPDPVSLNILRWKSDLSGFENTPTSSATILSQINDSDGDTKINVEESSDEDIIRFDVAGTQKGRWDATGLNIAGNDVAPDGPLHIGAGLAGVVAAHVDADEFILESSANTGLTILSGTTGLGSVHFGDSGDNDIGKITYNHSDNAMRFYQSGALEGRWDSTGLNIGGNDVTGDGPLHIGAGLAGVVTANTNADDGIFEGAGHTGVSIIGGNAESSNLYFGDDSNHQLGTIRYTQNNDFFVFGRNNGDEIQLRSGEIYINGGDANVDFHIRGQGAQIFFADASQGNAAMGINAADASALLDMVSTTKGLGLPTWTTTQRNAISTPRDGLIGHNSTTNTVDARLNSAWVSLASSISVGWTLLEFQSVGTVASVDMTTGIDSTYDEYVLIGNAVTAATDDVEPLIRFSTDGGATWEQGAGAYTRVLYGNSNTAAVSRSDTSTSITMATGTGSAALGNASQEKLNFIARLIKPSNGSEYTTLVGTAWFNQASGGRARIEFYAEWTTTTAVDAWQFLLESGNITGGGFYTFGVRKS